MQFEFKDFVIFPDDPSATPERITQYKDYYKIKYDICAEIKPKRIAEIGVRAGYSAWTFMQAAPTAEYYGFDANNGTHGGAGGEDGKFAAWAKKLLLPYNTTVFQMDTQKQTTLPVHQIDLFHVDGDHTTMGVRHDLDLALTCLSDTGRILVDDITYIREVSDGVFIWLDEHKKDISYKFIPSLRGEMLIWKK